MAKRQQVYNEKAIIADLRGRFDLPIMRAIEAAYERHTRRKYYGAPIDYTAWLERRPTRAERSALSRSMARLERRGLIVRVPGRRAVLTKIGQKIIEAVSDNR